MLLHFNTMYHLTCTTSPLQSINTWCNTKQYYKKHVQYCAMQEYIHTALYATVLGGERRVVGLYDPKFPRGLRIEWTNNSSTTSSLVWKTKDGLPPKDSSDRVVSVIFVSRPVYIAMSTVSFLGMLVAVGFLVFNIKLRKIR